MYQTGAIPAQAYPQHPQNPVYPLHDRGRPDRGGEGRWRMVAEERGVYDATPKSDPTNDPTEAQEAHPAENVTPFPQQPQATWTRVANTFMQVAFSKLSLGATRCFLYILRYSEGFHQESVALALDELCHGKRFKQGRLDEGTELARTAVVAGLRELASKGLIEITATGRGRGMVSVYRILPVEAWHITIGSKSLPIQDDENVSNGSPSLPIPGGTLDVIGSKSLPIVPINGSERLPQTALIGSKSLPLLKKERNKGERKERSQTDASASGVASPQRADVTTEGDAAQASQDDEWGNADPVATQGRTHPTELLGAPPQEPRRPPTTKPAAKRERKMTDEQYAAHQAEQAWCSQLLAAFRAELGVAELPEEGAEKAAAKWYYRNLQGVEDGVGKVLTCYRILKSSPFWAHKPRTLLKMKDQFNEYRRDPAGFRKDHEAEAARAVSATAARPSQRQGGYSGYSTPDVSISGYASHTMDWDAVRAQRNQRSAANKSGGKGAHS